MALHGMGQHGVKRTQIGLGETGLDWEGEVGPKKWGRKLVRGLQHSCGWTSGHDWTRQIVSHTCPIIPHLEASLHLFLYKFSFLFLDLILISEQCFFQIYIYQYVPFLNFIYLNVDNMFIDTESLYLENKMADACDSERVLIWWNY